MRLLAVAAVFLALGTGACADPRPAGEPKMPPPATSVSEVGASKPAPAAGAQPTAPPAPPTATAAPAPPASAPAPAAQPEPPAPAPEPRKLAAASGTDFAAQVRAMYRVAACGGDDPLPERFSAKVIERHCKEMAETYASYRKAWADPAGKFIADLRPLDAPKTVVYPFGGGDLVSALVVYPNATEITTISLEAPGDVRAIDTIDKSKLAADLATISHDIRRLYTSAHSTTKSLQAASHSTLPGTLMFALAALVVHGMEPVGLRYFDLQPDGSPRYLTTEEMDQRAAEFEELKKAGKKGGPKPTTHFWYAQDTPFGNVEIRFRPRGDVSGAPRIYRHIVQNVDDQHMAADDRLLVHLRQKGKVSVMTKAASFLLWYDDFSKIREYLLKHVAWMISDASGLPPSYAEPAGFEQITYGQFVGPYFIIDPKNTRAEFVKLWKAQPRRPLPFRFGYPDAEKNNHLMITRPKTAPDDPAKKRP
ncbi:MAG TPA: hypothetical protein VNO30_42860 [Kofleriaceae bacterium]|nr:hypothetical protein [Kofleriaceae bacterium]